MRAANAIYEVEEGRSFITLRPLQILVTLTLVVLLALFLVALVVTGPVASKVGSAIGASTAAVTIWDIAKWPVLIIVVIFMIAVLYYAAPNARLRGVKSIMPGALLALVIWLIASLGFAYYVANFGSYNKTYGTLGGVIVLLVWLWISNAAILLGAEVNAERERSRQLRAGTPGAERELQLEERSVPARRSPSSRPMLAPRTGGSPTWLRTSSVGACGWRPARRRTAASDCLPASDSAGRPLPQAFAPMPRG